RVAVSNDGTMLYVSNAKGLGAGPNGGRMFHEGPEGTYIGDITKGQVSIVRLPRDRDLKAETRQVLRNNGFIDDTLRAPRGPDFPVPASARASATIHHVIFIVKENRTFDQVFGDLAEVGGQRINSERGPLEYGEDIDLKAETGEDKSEGKPASREA